jgi:galactofuranose transport system ATP-binding protein
MVEADPAQPLLCMSGISKTFPGVQALSGVDFDVRPGEVHALMGENGAGKSTLIKVLTGAHRRDDGRVTFAGREISPHAPIEAEAVGISTVYQEVNLIPHLSVAENIMLGRQPRKAGFLSWESIRWHAQKAVERVDLDVDINRELCTCSPAIQQMVAIARAVSLNARLLVLDEPTSSLDEKEVDELFTVLKRLRTEKLGIVFITHFLDQVYRLSDRITVLRNGEKVGTFQTSELPQLELVGKMLGKKPDEIAALERRVASAHHAEHGECKVLEAKRLGRKGAVEAFDLDVYAGEVVGLAGLLGSGRTEAIRLFFGLDRATGGTLTIDGQTMTRPTPSRAIEAGVAFCPEDRKLEGVILALSVRENILLAMQASRGLAGGLPLKKQQELAKHYIKALRIKTPSPETRVGTLSGGNQQKVLLARWLAMSPKLIILDEPTRGIDVGAKAEIETLVDSLRQEGMAIVFISSELEEVVRTCQRVAVMRDRKKLGELSGDEIQEKAIMEMIAQHHDD